MSIILKYNKEYPYQLWKGSLEIYMIHDTWVGGYDNFLSILTHCNTHRKRDLNEYKKWYMIHDTWVGWYEHFSILTHCLTHRRRVLHEYKKWYMIHDTWVGGYDNFFLYQDISLPTAEEFLMNIRNDTWYMIPG